MPDKINLHPVIANATLILIGASVRAMAFSCIRAGYKPWCIDLYADADLQRVCPTKKITGLFPDEISEIIKVAPQSPILYTGGLENHPNFIDSLAKNFTVFGMTGKTLSSLRNCKSIFELLQTNHIATPATLDSISEIKTNTRYLIKPKNKSGGLGIRWLNSNFPPNTIPKDHYLQEYIEGENRSAIFCFNSKGFELLGVSKLWSGYKASHASDFLYSGNIGPLYPSACELQHLKTIGEALFKNFQPLGLLGLDYILKEDQVYALEINPRYTASVEVLELASQKNLISQHIQAFTGEIILPKLEQSTTQVVGKIIYYAPEKLMIPKHTPWSECFQNEQLFPTFADIPPLGTSIEKGSPVITLLAKGISHLKVKNELKTLINELDRFFAAGKAANKLF